MAPPRESEFSIIPPAIPDELPRDSLYQPLARESALLPPPPPIPSNEIINNPIQIEPNLSILSRESFAPQTLPPPPVPLNESPELEVINDSIIPNISTSRSSSPQPDIPYQARPVSPPPLPPAEPPSIPIDLPPVSRTTTPVRAPPIPPVVSVSTEEPLAPIFEPENGSLTPNSDDSYYVVSPSDTQASPLPTEDN